MNKSQNSILETFFVNITNEPHDTYTLETATAQ